MVVAAAALVSMPVGSADHTNYAAYGRIALHGGDPWTESPIAWAGGHDPVTSAVQPPWQTTPSIYGPLATLGQVLAAWIGGDNLRQVVWVWQWLIVVAWLSTRWLLRRLFPGAHGHVDVLWTLNPLVVGTGVLGAHVDTLATPLMVAALLAGRRAGWRPAVAAGMAAGLAIGIKVTAGVVLVALGMGWLRDARSERRVLAARAPGGPRGRGAVVAGDLWGRIAVGRYVAAAVGLLVVIAPLQWWAGPHAYDQLGRARRSISLATPWRKVYEWGGGHLADATWRSVVFAVAGVVCVVLAGLCWQVLDRARSDNAGAPGAGPVGSGATASTRAVGAGSAVSIALALSFAYAVGAPYVLPWYDQLVWALLPGFLAATALAPQSGLDQPGPYRLALWAGPLLCALAILPLVQAAPGRSAVGPGEHETSERPVGTFEVLADKKSAPVALLALWALVIFLEAMSEGSVRTFFNVLLDQSLGAPTATIGVVMGAAQLLPIAVALAVPFLLARWGTGYTLLAGILALVACLVPFALGAQNGLQTQSLLQIILLIGAPYLAAAATFSVIRASRNLFSQEMVIPLWRAHSQGTTTLGLAFGLSAIAISGGMLIEALGFGALFIAGVMTAVASAGLLFLYLYMTNRRRSGQALAGRSV